MKKALALTAALALTTPAYAIEPLAENPGYSDVQMRVRGVLEKIKDPECSYQMGMREIPKESVWAQYDAKKKKGKIVLRFPGSRHSKLHPFLVYDFTTTGNHIPNFLQISKWHVEKETDIPETADLFDHGPKSPIYTHLGLYGRSLDLSPALVGALVDRDGRGMLEGANSLDLFYSPGLLGSRTYNRLLEVKEDLQKGQREWLGKLERKVRDECKRVQKHRRNISNGIGDFGILKSQFPKPARPAWGSGFGHTWGGRGR